MNIGIVLYDELRVVVVCRTVQGEVVVAERDRFIEANKMKITDPEVSGVVGVTMRDVINTSYDPMGLKEALRLLQIMSIRSRRNDRQCPK